MNRNPNTKIIITKRNRFYRKIRAFLAGKGENPLTDWPLFKKLYSHGAITYKVNDEEKSFTIHEAANYPQYEKQEDGSISILVPDTRSMCNQIRNELGEGDKIVWVNKLGLWTQSVINLINRNNYDFHQRQKKKEEDGNDKSN